MKRTITTLAIIGLSIAPTLVACQPSEDVGGPTITKCLRTDFKTRNYIQIAVDGKLEFVATEYPNQEVAKKYAKKHQFIQWCHGD